MNWTVAISLFVSSIPIVKFVAEGIGVRAIQKTPSSKCKANIGNVRRQFCNLYDGVGSWRGREVPGN